MNDKPPDRSRWLAEIVRVPIRLLSAPVHWFLAPDVFVSYASRDAADFAERLAEQFSKARWSRRLSCMLDRLEARVSATAVPPSVLRGARYSRLRVVIVSPASRESKGMGEELAYAYAGRRAAPRAMLVLFPDARGRRYPWPDDSPPGWFAYVKGARELEHAPVDWAQSAALRPNAELVATITRTVGYLNQRVRIVSAAVLALMLIAGATGVAVDTGRQAQALSTASRALELALRSPVHAPQAASLALQSAALHVNQPASDLLRSLWVSSPPLHLDVVPPCGADQVAIDAPRMRLAMGHLDRICVIELKTGAITVLSLTEPAPVAKTSALGPLLFDSEGVLWAFSAGDLVSGYERLDRFEPSRLERLPPQPLGFPVSRAWTTPAGDWLLLAAESFQKHRFWAMPSGAKSTLRPQAFGVPDSRAEVVDVRFSADGQWLFTVARCGYQAWSRWTGDRLPKAPAWTYEPSGGAGCDAPLLRAGASRFAVQEYKGETESIVVRSLPDFAEQHRFAGHAADMGWTAQDDLVVLNRDGTRRRGARGLGLSSATGQRPYTMTRPGQSDDLMAMSRDGRCLYYPVQGRDADEVVIRGLLGTGLHDVLAMGMDTADTRLFRVGDGCALVAVGNRRVRFWHDLSGDTRVSATFDYGEQRLAADADLQRVIAVGRSRDRQTVRFIRGTPGDSSVSAQLPHSVLAIRLRADGTPQAATPKGVYTFVRWPVEGTSQIQAEFRPWPRAQAPEALPGEPPIALPEKSTLSAVGYSTASIAVIGADGKARIVSLPGAATRVRDLWLSRDGQTLGVQDARGRGWTFHSISKETASGPLLNAQGLGFHRPIEAGGQVWAHHRDGDPDGTGDRTVLLRLTLSTGALLPSVSIASGGRALCVSDDGHFVAVLVPGGQMEIVSDVGRGQWQVTARVPGVAEAVHCSFDAELRALRLLSAWGASTVLLDDKALAAAAGQRMLARARRGVDTR